ncbi:MAG: alpha/beta hydrolase [Verrucomicrobiota bacterium]|nr:alpha/beta hydrolase [Verrucomicrobiota bacterium]
MATAQTEIPLWDGNMPGKGAEGPEGISPNKDNHVVRLTNVSEPTLAFYPAKDTGKSNPMAIVCPGGGYNILAYNLEGTEVAEWLNSIGVSAAILKYRVPNNRAGALEDARRAVRLVRENSKDWNIDPKRIGMLGFSAGGHLAAACSNSPDRPDFTVLVYPAYLFKDGGIGLVDEIRVDANTPPAFVVQTQDDKKYYRSTLAYAAALDAAGIPVESHLFAKGGHGYGLRPSDHPVSQWPSLCEAWMRESGLLE